MNDFKVSSSMFNRHSRVNHDTSLQAHRAPSAVKHDNLAAKKSFTALGEGAPGTFDFLGFTHYCGTSRAGKFKLKRKTATKKLRAKFRELKDWFRENLRKPTAEVWQTLCAKLQGHFQYYNVNDNWRWVVKYREAARRMGLRWLRRWRFSHAVHRITA